MTQREGLQKLIDYCDDQVDSSGWWIFFKRRIDFERTKLLRPHERIWDIKLPLRIRYPKNCEKSEGIIIDAKGINFYGSEFSWSEIVATGIKTEETADLWKESLLLILNSGRIIDWEVIDFNQYHCTMGDLMEQYKLEFKKLSNPTK